MAIQPVNASAVDTNGIKALTDPRVRGPQREAVAADLRDRLHATADAKLANFEDRKAALLAKAGDDPARIEQANGLLNTIIENLRTAKDAKVALLHGDGGQTGGGGDVQAVPHQVDIHA